MNTKRVAVSKGLDYMGKFLSEQGYEVVSLDPLSENGAELRNCEAIVIAGTDTNLMGMADIQTKSPVIEVEGKTPQQVLDQIRRRS